jgi:formylglycine-generating enzyme required for sulfatase activity
MAEVFISYKYQRRKTAEHLAAVLSYYGYTVWFDYQLIKGSDFGFQIDSKIRDAKAVVVLWCSMSVGSRWVIEEVDLAHKLGLLIPVKIEPCEPPVGFRLPEHIDLLSWDGSPRGHQLDPLIEALEYRIGRPPHLDLKGLTQYEAALRRFGSPSPQNFPLSAPPVGIVAEGHTPPTDEHARPTRASRPKPSPVIVQPSPTDHRWTELVAQAFREWPSVCDSRDPQRLESFERHFSGTFYAEEARNLRETILAEAQQRVDAEQHRAREKEFRAQGRIPVLVGDVDRSQTRWLLPGAAESFCDLDGGPEMVVVPAGSFRMGSPENEPERHRRESPDHSVKIARSFAVGRHAVTRGQFAAFAIATGLEADGAFRWIDKWTMGDFSFDPGLSWRKPGFTQDDSHPVTCVNWNEAKAYASWLATMTGKSYGLLTETEREYVARAGTRTPFWRGASITSAQANYDGNFVYGVDGTRGEFRRGTVPVDSFAPNPWGLYNVHGNVWE